MYSPQNISIDLLIASEADDFTSNGFEKSIPMISVMNDEDEN